MVEVTQADREAAWPFSRFHCLPDRQMRERWFSGYYDNNSVEGSAIQAFARHRAEALRIVQSAIDAERERCAREHLDILNRIESVSSVFNQWRTTIPVRFDGMVDFEQWHALNKAFDDLAELRNRARKIRGTTNEV